MELNFSLAVLSKLEHLYWRKMDALQKLFWTEMKSDSQLDLWRRPHLDVGI